MRLAWHAHVFAILGALLVVPIAHAERAKVECARAAEKAQQLRIDGHLMDARGALHACLRPACPKVIRSYCTRWFDEVESDLPSVVVSVHDASGNDLSGVTLTVDGKIEDSWRAGLPIELDPGEHLFRYERAGSKRLETKVRVSLGEKKRLLSVTLEEAMDGFAETDADDVPVASELPESSEIPPVRSAEPAAAEPSEPAHRKRIAAWVMSGTAVAAIGSFAYFGITGRSDLSQLRHDCAGHCESSKVDAAWNKLIIADVSLGLAVVSTGLATWLFVASREKRGRHSDEAARRMVPSVALLPDKRSFGLGLGARF